MSNDKLADALEHTARHRAATEGIDPDQWRVVLFKWEALALQAHVAEAAQDAKDAKDAARYRWLRDKSGRDGQPYIRCDDPPFEPMDYWVTAATADACIDRAIAKESGNG